jgi:hypothetical protein
MTQYLWAVAIPQPWLSILALIAVLVVSAIACIVFD